MVSLYDIQRVLKGELRISEPLASYTTFRIGGPADYFMVPVSKDDLTQVVGYLHEHECAFLLIGNGSNLLVSDDGYRGAVIQVEKALREIRMEGDCVYVEAGVRLARFVDFCIHRSLGGTEMLAGIPGTIGGAVVMNAGAHGSELSDHLTDVEILHNGRVERVPRDQAGFVYRCSGFEGDVVLAARFALRTAEKEELMRTRRSLLIKRNATQPVNIPNAGSIFKNPAGTTAATLIEKAGLKGRRHGGAMISPRHANFIVNEGDAKASDIRALITLIQSTVRKKYALDLELEVKLVGFDNPVLMKVA